MVRETEYESDPDGFNGNGYNRFSMISSYISTPGRSQNVGCGFDGKFLKGAEDANC